MRIRGISEHGPREAACCLKHLAYDFVPVSAGGGIRSRPGLRTVGSSGHFVGITRFRRAEPRLSVGGGARRFDPMARAARAKLSSEEGDEMSPLGRGIAPTTLVVFCTAVAVALVAVGTASAAVGVNCVKPFDLTSKNQDLTNCKMNGVTIPGSELPGDAMQFSNFSGASLNGATVGDVLASFTLRDVNLTNARLVGITVDGDGSFYSATAPGATLKSSLIGGTGAFEAATLTGANLRNIQIPASSFSLAFQFAILQGADLSGAIIGGDGSFDYANLNGANLAGATISANDAFSTPTLAVPTTTLVGASLVKAIISGSNDFSNADLTGADLTGAIDTGSNNFQGAVFSNTICPDGTNSDNDGGTCLGHGIS